MGYYSAIKKNETLPFVTTWIDLESITLSEASQTEKDKYDIISLLCGIEKTYQPTNQPTNKNQKQTHEYRELVGAKGEGAGGMGETGDGDEEAQTSACKISKSQG